MTPSLDIASDAPLSDDAIDALASLLIELSARESDLSSGAELRPIGLKQKRSTEGEPCF